MATGYHYTSADNWARIQVEGLRRYPLNKPEMADFFTEGVLVWPEPHGLESEIGSVLWQANTKHVHDVVLLEVTYFEYDLAVPVRGRWRPGDSLDLTHNGTYADGCYFHQDLSFVVLRSISPERIRLLACFHVPAETLAAEMVWW